MRLVVGATWVALFVVGLLLGAVEAFLVPARVGGIEGLAVVVALVGNLGAGLLGGFGTATAAGAGAPAFGWFVATALIVLVAPGGDVVIPGALGNDPGVVQAGEITLGVGLLASIVPIALTSRYTKRVKPPKGLS